MNHNKRVVLIGVKTLLCDKFPLGGGGASKGNSRGGGGEGGVKQ